MKIKNRTIIICLLLLTPILTNAQTDSLLFELKNTTDKTTKINLYHKLAKQTKNFEEALAYSNKALAIAKTTNRKELIADCYYFLGVRYYKNYKYSEVLPFVEKSYGLYLELKDTAKIAKNALMLGRTYDLTGNYEKTIEYYLIRLDWEKKQNNAFGIDKAYYGLSYSYAELDDFETALKYANLCYEFEKENDLDISYGQDILAGIYERMGNYAKAKKYYQLALANTKDEPTSEDYGWTLSNIGNIYMLSGDYDSAMYYFLDFLEIATNNNDDYSKAVAYNQIAEIQLELSELEDAKKNILSAIEYYKTEEIKTDYLISLELLSKILIQQKDYKEAKKIVNEGMKVSQTAGSKSFLINFYIVSGQLKRITEQYKLALKEYTKALDYAQEINNLAEISIIYYEMALTEKILSNYDKAFDLAENSLVNTLQSKSKEKLHHIYQLLAELAALRGQYNTAYEYQLRYQSIQDSMLSNEREKYLTKYYAEFQVDEKEAENEILKDKQAQSQAVIQQRTILTILSLLILALVSAIAFILRRNNQLKTQQNETLEDEVQKRTQELISTNQELEEVKQKQIIDEAKARFFANVSHEFRTPLTLIQAPLEHLLKTDDLSIKARTTLSKVLKSSDRLMRLVTQLLDFSKLDQSKLQLETSTQFLLLVVRRVMAHYESYIHQNELELHLDYQANPNLQLELDKGKFEGILHNYISNAIKFSPRHGKIQITIKDVNNIVELSVADEGIGIPNSELNKVFDRYYQVSMLNQNDAHEPTNQYTAGTGIGLSICREYAKLFDGKVWVESEGIKGKGSTFYFEFPKKEVFKTVSQEDAAIIQSDELASATVPMTLIPNLTPSATDTEKDRILIVEDNYDLRLFLEEILQNDYQITTAENGRAALKKLENNDFSLIISDVMMPIMDGFELLQQVKASPEYQQIPMVMLTARAAVRDKLDALRIGVDDYILKPFNEEELKVRISNLISNAYSRKEQITETSITTPTEATTEEQAYDNNLSIYDQQFMRELEQIVKKSISNVQLKVIDVADEMHMGRTTLFRKVKSCTGLTVNQYIKEYRLQYARELLEKGEVLSTKEVAYSAGFKHVNYFSILFEKRFGRRPSTYI